MEHDVKKALKDAKEHIKSKDFGSALECCKVLLNLQLKLKSLLILTFNRLY